MRALLAQLFLYLTGLGRRLDHIETSLERLILMSDATQSAVDHVAAAVASLKTELGADVAAVSAKVSALQQEIADLKAAGSGATADQVASLEASASEIDADVKTMHDALNPDTPTV